MARGRSSTGPGCLCQWAAAATACQARHTTDAMHASLAPLLNQVCVLPADVLRLTADVHVSYGQSSLSWSPACGLQPGGTPAVRLSLLLMHCLSCPSVMSFLQAVWPVPSARHSEPAAGAAAGGHPEPAVDHQVWWQSSLSFSTLQPASIRPPPHPHTSRLAHSPPRSNGFLLPYSAIPRGWKWLNRVSPTTWCAPSVHARFLRQSRKRSWPRTMCSPTNKAMQVCLPRTCAVQP